MDILPTGPICLVQRMTLLGVVNEHNSLRGMSTYDWMKPINARTSKLTSYLAGFRFGRGGPAKVGMVLRRTADLTTIRAWYDLPPEELARRVSSRARVVQSIMVSSVASETKFFGPVLGQRMRRAGTFFNSQP